MILLRFRSVVAAMLLLGAAGCSTGGNDSDGKETDDRDAKADPLAGAPKIGSCYRLTEEDYYGISTEAEPVECDGRQNSFVYHVGRLEVGSGETPGTFARRECRSRLPVTVGLSPARLPSTTFDIAAFQPSAAQHADGAAWYRCDLVAHGRQWALSALPEGAPPYYAGGRLPDRYLACVDADIPNNRGVPCNQPHTHRWFRSFEGPAVMPTTDELRTFAQRCETLVPTPSWYATWPQERDWIAGLNRISCYADDAAGDPPGVTPSPPAPA